MIERIIDCIYWTVFGVAIVFEVSVLVTILVCILLPVCVLLLLYLVIWSVWCILLTLLHYMLCPLRLLWNRCRRRSR